MCMEKWLHISREVIKNVEGMEWIGYSMKRQRRKSESKNVEIFKIITGITEVIALVVVII